jgi:transcriptional regulator with XRE-family HTH domain
MGSSATVAATGSPTVRHSGRPRRHPLPPGRALDDPAAGFADLLAGFRQRAGLSQCALGRRSGVNASYLNRLESGERRVPTPLVAAALAQALALSPQETDRLLWSIGAVPPSLQRLDSAAPTLLAVARLLSDPRLAADARADLRACIETLARWWDAQTP